ncbi:MAG TPA: glycosyltransferase family 87 protein [Vicinamibacterales bacterium]
MRRYRGSSMRTRLLLAVLAAVSLLAVFTTRVSRKMPDFQVYWTAGDRALAAEPLYRAEDEHYQFKYLPAFALLASPLALVPLPMAKALWFALSAVLITALLWLSAVAISPPKRPLIVLVIVTFLAMAKFYAHELVLGQVNLLFAALVMLAVVQMRHGHEAAAGVLLGIAVVVKPYAAIFAPWLAVRPNRTAFVLMIATVAAALVVPAARYGWSQNVHLLGEWWMTVKTSTAPNLTNQDNVSLAAMFTKWLGPDSAAPTLALLASALLVALTAIVVVARVGLRSPEPLEAALLLTLIPLISPQGWDYVFLIATPAVMLIIDNLHQLPPGLRLATAAAIAIAGLSIYDLVGRDAYAAFMASSAITICFLVEVAALVTLRFRRAA